MGRRIREFDWDSHPLGNPHYWPPALQMAMSLCLNYEDQGQRNGRALMRLLED